MTMNALALLLAATTAMFTTQNEMPGNVRVCTNVMDVLDSVAPTSATWTAKGAWDISYRLRPDSYVTTNITFTTDDCFRTWSNYEEAVVHTASAECFARKLDGDLHEPFSVTNWRCLTPGGTFSNNVLKVSSFGESFRIAADNANGTTEFSDIHTLAQSQGIRSSSEYVDDSSPYRKAVNDQAMTVLNNSVRAGPTNQPCRWVTFECPSFKPFGGGHSFPLAVSTRTLVASKHYRDGWGGKGWKDAWKEFATNSTVPFVDSAGVTNYVRMTDAFCLHDWIQEGNRMSGWTDDEKYAATNSAYLSDCIILPVHPNTPVPTNCVPYLISELTSKEMFGKSLDGLAGWAGLLNNPYVTPVVFTDNHPYYGRTFGQEWEAVPGYPTYKFPIIRGGRIDIRNKISAMIPLNEAIPIEWTTEGTSGYPIFIMLDGKYILVSHFYSFMNGPDYVRGFKAVKTAIEYCGGTVKEFTK